MLDVLADIIAQVDAKSGIFDHPLTPIVITAAVTSFAAWLTFRGKIQDTANWLIVALRQDAEDARDDAREARIEAREAFQKASQCELREEDSKQQMQRMMDRITVLEGILRNHELLDTMIELSNPQGEHS